MATVLKALEIIKSEPERRTQLLANAQRIRDGLRRMGYNVGESETPIVPVIIGENDNCFAMWKTLFEMGVFTNPVVSPATPPGWALLRVSCMATHTPEVLDRALEIFQAAGRRMRILSG